jgi:outer membrane protein assembly factor BamB
MKKDCFFALWLLTILAIGITFKIVNAEKRILTPTINWEKSIKGEVVGYPLLDNTKCYLTIYKNKKLQVLALNLNDGKKSWEVSLPYYREVLPLLEDGQQLFVSTNSSFRGTHFTLDKITGSLKWTFKGKSFIFSKHFPFILNRAELIVNEIVTGSRTIILPLGASRLLALDSETGQKKWTISLGWGYAPLKVDLIENRLYWKVGGLFFQIVNMETGKKAISPLSNFVHTQITKPDSAYCIGKDRLFLRIEKEEEDQISCYDLTTGKSIWDIQGDHLFPIKSEGNTLYAYYRPRGIKPGLFKSKYSLISIDGQTGNIEWSVPCELIRFIQKKGNYALINTEDKGCQLITSEEGIIVWDSKYFLEENKDKEETFCVMDEEGTNLLVIIGERIFWLRIRT